MDEMEKKKNRKRLSKAGEKKDPRKGVNVYHR